jgi:hypothetical protein
MYMVRHIGTSCPYGCLPLCGSIITDFTTFGSDAVALEIEEHEVRIYGVRLANDVLRALPELNNMGVCVVVYDVDEQPVSIVPLDPVQ